MTQTLKDRAPEIAEAINHHATCCMNNWSKEIVTSRIKLETLILAVLPPLPLADDKGLGNQVREFSETLKVFSVVKKEFWPDDRSQIADEAPALHHEWTLSRSHPGETVCKHCGMTNTETAAAGITGKPCPTRVLQAKQAAGPPLELSYRNHRGDVSVRKIFPQSVRFGTTPWHTEPQWLLLAYDSEKAADREFAMADFAPVALQAENTRLKGALYSIANIGVDFGHFEAAALTMQEIARDEINAIEASGS